jgi:nucleotide-binding universal stress UspA family protein
MFKKILFLTDFSKSSHKAFKYALNLAKTYQARLLILYVIPDLKYPEQLLFYLPPKKLEELKTSQMEEINRELTTHYFQKMEGFKDYKVLLDIGVAFNKIIEITVKEAVDLIIIGNYVKKGMHQFLFGSTAEEILKRSSCPVLIVGVPKGKVTNM